MHFLACFNFVSSLEYPLQLLVLQHQVCLQTRRPQVTSHRRCGPPHKRGGRSNQHIDIVRGCVGQQTAVLQQLNYHCVAEAEAHGRCGLAPKRRQQRVVPSTPAYGPELSLDAASAHRAERTITLV